MIAVTGFRTTIVRELSKLVSEEIVRVEMAHVYDFKMPAADRFVFAAGYLAGKPAAKQEALEIKRSFDLNVVNVVALCEAALTRPRARIVVIGSQSAVNGSHDEVYAASKAALHAYVSFRKVGPEQVLACVAPGIIRDSGMTLRRPDAAEVIATRPTLSAAEVARQVHDVLYGDWRSGAHMIHMTGSVP